MEVYMKESIREKLTGKGAYIILVLLIATILTLSIVSIVSAVNKKDDAKLPDGAVDSNTPSDGETPSDGTGDGTDTPSDTPSDSTDEKPGDTPAGSTDETVYSLPCEGAVQKDYSEDVLVFSQTMNDHRIHLGLDISGKLGDPVKAVAEGIIEKIFSDPFMGKTIVIDHGNGLHSYYMNLASAVPEEIKEGISVKNGTVIGAIGETAMTECADEPHLHFEIRLDGAKVNPRNYITVPSFSETDETQQESAS
ncbi:MAG: M23 family metallopeptidase [Ruminococcaceae bacterium]|nr:M23 family metallopeptidase [Oscillospiraceae bacterium]